MALALAKTSVAKSRMTSKGRYRPHAMVRKKMPDGTGQLSELPVRARLAERPQRPQRGGVQPLARACLSSVTDARSPTMGEVHVDALRA